MFTYHIEAKKNGFDYDFVGEGLTVQAAKDQAIGWMKLIGLDESHIVNQWSSPSDREPENA